MATRLRQSRVFLHRNDNFNGLTDEELIRTYRLGRACILFSLSTIETKIQPATNRIPSVSALTKLFVTLRFLATVKFQQRSAVEFCLSQPTICKILGEVVDGLSSADTVKRLIKVPSDIAEVRLNQ